MNPNSDLIGLPVSWFEVEGEPAIGELPAETTDIDIATADVVRKQGRIKYISPDAGPARRVIVDVDDGTERAFTSDEAEEHFGIDLRHHTSGRDMYKITKNREWTDDDIVEFEEQIDVDVDDDDDGYTWRDVYRHLKAEFVG